MKKAILDRSDLKTVLEFDSETGDAHVTESKLVHGVGSEVCISGRNKFIALYANSGTLYFHINGNTFDVSKAGLVFSNRKIQISLGFLKEFLVSTSDGQTVFKTIYINKRFSHWKNMIDITYDDFDSELDDIYLWLAKECNDPKFRRELTMKWSIGVAAP